MSIPDVNRHWHLDRRVPVALITTIIMQTIGIVWWAASISSRVDVLEHGLQEARHNQSRIIRLEANQNAVYQRLDRIEAASRRIEAKLDRLIMAQVAREKRR